MERLIIEVYHRTGFRIPQRYRFKHYPVRIGRAYFNDVVVADPHVSPEHLVICENDKGWVVRDKHSRNGILHNGKRRQGEDWFPITSGDQLTIGKTKLLILSPFHPVAATERLAEPSLICRWIGHPVIALLLLTFMSLQLSYTSYINSWQHNELSYYIKELLPIWVITACWAVGWGFIGRISRHRMRLWRHISMISLYFIFVECTGNFSEMLAYMLNADMAVTYGFALLWAACFAWLVSASLRAATHIGRRTRRISGIIAATLITIAGFSLHLSTLNKDEEGIRPHFSTLLRPTSWHLSRPRTPQEFLDGASPIFTSK